jgi:tripartite-type tricarboxylate transporter receptor subunit TctC
MFKYLVSTALMLTPVLAQDYPNKTITMVVPFAAGGSTDITSRIIAEKMSRMLGQSVIIENRAGAGGNTGAAAVAKANPDGYTILMGTISTHTLNSAFYKNMPYDPIKSFEHVSLILSMPLVLEVSKKSGIKNLDDLIKAAKAAPDTLTYASSGNGTPLHVSGEMLNTMAGIKLRHLPYRGGGPALNDVVAGHVTMMIDNLTSSIEQIKAGNVVAIAVTTKERSKALPDLPSLHELGLKGFDSYSWTGMFLPAGTPKAIVDKLNATVNEAIKDPEVKRKLEDASAVLIGSTPEVLKTHVQQQLDIWLPIAKASGVSAE